MSCQIYTLILEVCLCSMKCSETRFHPALSYSDIVGLVLMVKNGSRVEGQGKEAEKGGGGQEEQVSLIGRSVHENIG